jgi:hypothetical protein
MPKAFKTIPTAKSHQFQLKDHQFGRLQITEFQKKKIPNFPAPQLTVTPLPRK